MAGSPAGGKWCAWLTAGLLLSACEETSPFPATLAATGGSTSAAGSAAVGIDPNDPEFWQWRECGRVPQQEAPLQLAFGASGENLLVFLRNGDLLDAEVRLVNPALPEPSTAPGATCLSPDGVVLTDRSSTSWRFWHVGERSASRELPLPAEPCGPSLTYSADGQHLLAFGDGPACAVDAQTGQVVARVAAPATSLGWFGGKLSMPFGNQGVTSFDADGHSQITSFEPLALPRQEAAQADEPFDSTVISPAGDRAAVHSRGYGFGLYDAQTGALLSAHHPEVAHTFRPVFSPDGAYVFLGDRVLRCSDASVAFEPPGLPTGYEAAALSNSGKHIGLLRLSADGLEGVAVEVDASSGRLWFAAGGHHHPVLSVAISPDGKRAVTTTGASLLAWELAEADSFDQSRVGWSVDAGLALNARYSADGSLLAVSSDKPQVFTAEGASVFRPQVEPPGSGCRSLQTLAFSPDGRWVARSGYGTTDVFEQGTWNKVAQLASKGCIVAAAFSPDSRYLMTSIPELFETDGWAQAWDSELIVDGSPYAYDVAFLPSGREAISSACSLGRPGGPAVECFARLFSSGGRLIGPLTGLSLWPSFAADGDWIITGNIAMYRRAFRPDIFNPELKITASTFAPNGDIIAGASDGSLVRLCKN